MGFAAVFLLHISLTIPSITVAQQRIAHPMLGAAVTQAHRAASASSDGAQGKEKLSGATPEQTLSVYSHGDPTAEEQYMLELVNRARANPPAEGVLIATTADADISGEFTYWAGQDANEPSRSKIQSDFSKYPSRPPLAFNSSLLKAAHNHSQDMLAKNYQGHQESDGSWPWDRAKTAGYGSTYVGENAYCYGKSIWEIDAGFLIDFGSPNDTVLGHRENVLNFQPSGSMYSEIGLGIIHGGTGLPNVGPIITTQDFGDNGKTFVLGVVYDDQNHNGFYDIGEGLAGATITVSGGTYTAVTSTSGGYAVPYSGSGTITVTASGGGLAAPISHQVQFNGENVKVDFTKDYAGLPAQVQLVLPIGDTLVTVDTAHFVWGAVTGATKYRIQLSTDSTLKAPILTDSLLTTPKKTFVGLRDSVTYYWRVQALNAKGWGPYSPIESFRVGLVPNTVVLVSPADGINTGSSDVTFTWQNPNPSNVTAYWFELSTSSKFSTLYRSDTLYDPTIPSEKISGTDFLPGVTYYWRVFAVNDNGWSASSAVRHIVAGSLSVADNSASVLSPVSVSPNPTTGETNIRFSLATTSDISLKVFNALGEEIESIVLGKLSPSDYCIPWNANNRADGAYFYQLRVGKQTQTGRIVVIR